MKKRLRASLTIEAAVIVPIILLIFAVLMHILFYWHDKNVLTSTSHEVAVLGSFMKAEDESAAEKQFYNRIKNKLLLLNQVECEVSIEEESVTVLVTGKKGASVVKVKHQMKRTEPEQYIRELRKIEKLGEGIGQQD